MRARALIVGVATSLIALAACGGGSSKDTSSQAKALCSVSAPVLKLGSVSENPDDTKGVQAAMTAAETALGKVSAAPPADVKSAVDTVTKVFTAANAALKKANYSFDSVAQADYPAIDALNSADLTRALDEIQAWSKKNC